MVNDTERYYNNLYPNPDKNEYRMLMKIKGLAREKAQILATLKKRNPNEPQASILKRENDDLRKAFAIRETKTEILEKQLKEYRAKRHMFR
jgi:hypothetical protein